MKPSTAHGIFALLLLASGTAHAINCKEAITTPDLNHCAKQAQELVEVKLNKVYQQTLKELSQPDSEQEDYSEMKRKLIGAQRAWVKFRELDCDAVYTFHAGGTIRTVMFIGCMQKHAERRIKDLEDTYGAK